MITSSYLFNNCWKNLATSNINKFLQTNVRALIEALSKTRREGAFDANFGTNNAGMDLYAVLVELSRTGIPVAYLFIKKDNSIGSAPAETMTQIFNQFLRY